jgi:hypothetical protein
MPDAKISEYAVLERVLLETLSARAEGTPTATAYDLIGSRYEFPAEWYRELPKTAGYEFLSAAGYPDWRVIPQAQLIELVKTEPQWQNKIRWARNGLKTKGYLDENAPRGVWRLTKLGLKAAGTVADQPLPPEVRRLPQRAAPGPTPPRIGEERSTPREALTRKLETLAHSMAIRDLELLVDIARIVRSRSLED